MGKYYTKYNIKTFFSSSKFTYHNKLIDRAIRTIRDDMGLDLFKLADINLMRQCVNYYNNTIHSSLKLRDLSFKKKWTYYTPAPMNNNIDLEWRYIRQMDLKVKKLMNKPEMQSLLFYKPDNILLIHLDLAKTNKAFEKRRRIFNELATFNRYVNGNVECTLLRPYQKIQTVQVPLMYTKYICENIESLPKYYKEYFLL
ncbi:hypothetical protein TRFO_40245 [Tritrichomonas foetus]|uniref:Integrase catalytic domain-containing protein n=1 Tax=Tritrichomonas foetus TaxID=1144522 RepID=A0A1J4J1T3_9EUKA|nr:hypothetical protein TRFO_40245 [Tritrichomonas foetus]|eukprot:OHS93472.1 hypothetical protein TRFO_40245 [Tritrichomonas foetus]